MCGIRRLMLLFTLGMVLLAGGIGGVASSFTDSEGSPANSFQAWVSTQWLQTTRADFESGILSRADTRSSTDNVTLAKDSHIYALQGGSTNFWRYGVPYDSWASMTGAPNTVGAGGALAYDGIRYVYALRGNNSRNFWRYDTVGGTWTALSNTPANVSSAAGLLGGALTYVGPQWVYAFRGTNQTTFWRYNIAANTWATMAAAPAAVGGGGALAYDGSRYIYAFRGNNRTAFWRYDTTSNSWATRTAAPGRVGPGGALAYDGSRYLYAFRGNGTTAFWRYDTTGNLWTAMNVSPAVVDAGGALAYAGLSYLYAFQGNGTTAFWRYDAIGNSWTTVANALGSVAAGGSLAFVGASTYVNPGTIASQVRDTGTAGARWDALFWDETLQLNTDITFEVRASDTLFAADNATLPWTSVGGTSPVTSGLPFGRYMQWRATLTTLDITVTPVLEEVRVYHY